jgi:hypothetical protein
MTHSRTVARLIFASLLFADLSLWAQKYRPPPPPPPPPIKTGGGGGGGGYGGGRGGTGGGSGPIVRPPIGGGIVRTGSNGNVITVRGTNNAAPSSTVRRPQAANSNRPQSATAPGSNVIQFTPRAQTPAVPKLSATQETAAKARLAAKFAQLSASNRTNRGGGKPPSGGNGGGGNGAGPGGRQAANDNNVWSKTRYLTHEQNLAKHWSDHGKEFPEHKDQKEYMHAAQQFVRVPPPGSLVKTRKSNGDVIIYHPPTNTIVVATRSMLTRTMFRPDPKKHGKPTNMDYFNGLK